MSAPWKILREPLGVGYLGKDLESIFGGDSRQVDWNRSDIVTAAFAAGGPGAVFDPIRTQKLLFLVDREVSERIGGPYFEFRPYRYGPFDAAVYRVLEELAKAEEVRVDGSGRYPRYVLTESGYRRGIAVLDGLPEAVAKYLRDAARWVRLTPYWRILSAICSRYPDTAVNSVVAQPPSRSRAGHERPFLRGMTRAFDFTGTRHRSPNSPRAATSDADAIGDAWRAVGRELEEAMTRFGHSERLW